MQRVTSAADALAAARSLGPALRERAAQCDALRALPEDTIEDMQRSGLFQLMVPRKFGGAGLGFTELVSTGAEIAAACGSSGWVYCVLAGHNWCVALFPEQAQAEIFASPRTLTASILRYPAEVKPVAGGYRLTNGRGRFSSGIDHSDWVLLGVTVDRGGGPPEGRMVLVPRSDIEVVDDWHTFGMRGTGSRTVKIAEAFIPEHRSCSMADLARGTSPGARLHPDTVTLRVPFSVGAAWCLVGAPLGMARGAYATFAAGAAGKLRDLRAEQLAERGPLFARISSAAAEIDASVALILADSALLDGIGASTELDLPARARLRRDLAFAVGRCRHAVNSLFESAGGSAIYDGELLQRVWRDINAAGAHVAFGWDDAVNDFARASLGLPPSPFSRV
jgi:3-hydroxy-9,10-secoandrosta-1,3,5(10)-triene-9,17-dione monooxygenase